MNGAVYSMTGFATGNLQQPSHQIFTLDIRSVNSRFLDLSFKLPDSYRHLEVKFREVLSQRIRRGKCEVKLSCQTVAPYTSTNPNIRFDQSQLKALLALQAQIHALAPTATALSVAELIALTSEKSNLEQDVLCPDADLLAFVEVTLNDFMRARSVEGAKLTAAMLLHVQALRKQHSAVLPLIPMLVEQQRQKFLQRLADAVADSGSKITPSVAEERALAEATAFALRIDVTEEVNRLSSHLDEIESLLTKGIDAKGAGKAELGKRLEFLIQELQREANTLGSKSATLETTKIAVEMKVLIEQLREQVQNIE